MKPLSANGFVSVRISDPKDRHRHSRVYIRNAATYSVSGRLADRRIPPAMKVVVRSSSLVFFLVNVLLGLPIRRRLQREFNIDVRRPVAGSTLPTQAEPRGSRSLSDLGGYVS